MNTPDDVALHAKLSPDRHALTDLHSAKRWTYADLDLHIGRCAQVLQRRGFGIGDRVLFVCKNHPLLVITHFACARIGAILAPLNFRLSEAELKEQIEQATPRLVVVDGQLEQVANLAWDRLTLIEFEGAIAATKGLPEPIYPPANSDRPSLMLFTSGTSGRPKGALISERNLAETAINFSRLGQVTRDSVFLADAPMFHVIGLVSNIRPAMMHGACTLLSEGFDPPRTLGRLSDPALAVTHYFCVPQMAARLRADPTYSPRKLQALTGLFTGGAPHSPGAVRSLLDDGVPVANGFGMTEVGAVFGMPLDKKLGYQKAGAVGIPTPRVETKVVDDAGRPCPPGTPGELCIRGDTVFCGYFNNPQQTELSLSDGWFVTGDICRVDEDGFHYIVDRKKDMYISGGENVYPAQVEACLADYPGIQQAAVLGVPDEEWGEVGHLAVVPSPDSSPDPQAILNYLATQLAPYKVPTAVTLLAQLPTTGSGKVRKHILRQRLQDSESSEA